jgi:hypothetical protein
LNFYSGGIPRPAISTAGYNGSTLSLPISIAGDSSGNLIAANYIGGVTVFLGITTPVATPVPFDLEFGTTFHY